MTQYSKAALTRLALYEAILSDLRARNAGDLQFPVEGLLPSGPNAVILVGIVVRDATGTFTILTDKEGNVAEVATLPVDFDPDAAMKLPPGMKVEGNDLVLSVNGEALTYKVDFGPKISTDAGNVLTRGSDGGLYVSGVQAVPVNFVNDAPVSNERLPGLPVSVVRLFGTAGGVNEGRLWRSWVDVKRRVGCAASGDAEGFAA